MHIYALIPVAAILVSAAFGVVAAVWNSERRPSASVCAVFLFTGLWAFLDLMTFLEPDPDRAKMLIQWIHLPAMLLGPTVPWVLAQMFPQIEERLGRLARVGFSIAVVLGLAGAFLPNSILGVVPTEWGSWAPRYGLVSILLVPIGTILPVFAAYEAFRLEVRRDFEKSDRTRGHAVTIAVVISLLVTVQTEYVMPLLGQPAPRLGAISIALAAAVAWLRILHASDDLAVTSEGMARAMLEELHDGVALVQLDGTIRVSNMRFAEMLGSRSLRLTGTSISDRLDTPIATICEGLEDYECELRREGGDSLPISLSSSVELDEEGKAMGAVMVLRDRREIDVLRSRLMTSGRLAAIGELAAGIAHEVNNPIAFIRSDFNLLAERLSEIRDQISRHSSAGAEIPVLDRASRRIEVALEGIERVAEVVEDVRDFAHVGGAGQGGSDPAVLIEGAMRLARLQRGDEIDLRVEKGSCSEWIDSGQELKQVLLALILILVEAIEKGGSILASLESDGKILGITLRATGLVEDGESVLRQFEGLAATELGASQSELGLAVLTELIDEMGASFSIVETGPDAISVALQLPLDAGMI